MIPHTTILSAATPPQTQLDLGYEYLHCPPKNALLGCSVIMAWCTWRCSTFHQHEGTWNGLGSCQACRTLTWPSRPNHCPCSNGWESICCWIARRASHSSWEVLWQGDRQCGPPAHTSASGLSSWSGLGRRPPFWWSAMTLWHTQNPLLPTINFPVPWSSLVIYNIVFEDWEGLSNLDRNASNYKKYTNLKHTRITQIRGIQYANTWVISSTTTNRQQLKYLQWSERIEGLKESCKRHKHRGCNGDPGRVMQCRQKLTILGGFIFPDINSLVTQRAQTTWQTTSPSCWSRSPLQQHGFDEPMAAWVVGCGRPCTCSFQGRRRSDLIDSIN